MITEATPKSDNKGTGIKFPSLAEFIKLPKEEQELWLSLLKVKSRILAKIEEFSRKCELSERLGAEV